jgi:hypothetical protein
MRSRWLWYVGIVLALAVWTAVSYRIEQKQARSLAVLREMHEQGRAPDYEALFHDPDYLLKKRAVRVSVLLIGSIVAIEWLFRRAQRSK